MEDINGTELTVKVDGEFIALLMDDGYAGMATYLRKEQIRELIISLEAVEHLI